MRKRMLPDWNRLQLRPLCSDAFGSKCFRAADETIVKVGPIYKSMLEIRIKRIGMWRVGKLKACKRKML